MKFNRTVLVLLCVAASSVSLGATPSFDKDIQPFLDAYCMKCHNDKKQKGDFRIDTLSKDIGLDAPHWAEVMERVSSGEMPPEESSSLSEVERQQLVQFLATQLDRLAEQLQDDPGEVAMPRLTPYEYRNVIRDLSGGVVGNAGRFLPNEGGAGEGFANVGAAQVMTLPQYEKYVEAAKDTLRHLRVYPLKQETIASATVWSRYPRQAVDQPADARQEVIDQIIGWHVAQQQKWGEEHRADLEQRLGFVHAAYLEAAWRFRHREDQSLGLEEFAWVAVDVEDTDSEQVQLAPAALEKWWGILNRTDASPHVQWAQDWRELAKEPKLTPAEVRQRCVAIEAGSDEVIVETEDYAPPYEISFHEAREEVLEAAEKEGHWPFRIDIGEVKELFLIVTDAGDGNRGEYAVWRRGRFVFRDGSSQPWQDVVTIVGANSGREYAWGLDGEQSQTLSEDAVGAKPPGALKFTVPEGAIVFEVDLTLDEKRTEVASIQALVLKEKPKSQSYVPGRFVFGGKKRPVTAGAKRKQEQERALRKRNIAEANRTKIGLNAERNVLGAWTRTPIEAIGGPWPDQDADKYEPDFPYHYTVDEVLLNATEGDRQQLALLHDRLEALAAEQDEDQRALSAQLIVKSLARRAWRRPVSEDELETLLDLYQESRALGLSFDSSVKSALMAVLASPEFLYRTLDTAGESVNGVKRLTSHALASRLSLFLWASLPDDELLELADADQLQDPAVLRSQARRMLNDPRARSLATDFAGQLWGFNDFATFANPDAGRFPEFTPQLRQAMATEVELLLRGVFQQDRPLTDLLDADYSYLNRELMSHYGLEPPLQPDSVESWTRVKIPPPRAGLATTGLVLTKTSLPLRTSPVQRGVWVMENLLGRHLPNPPANVPALSEDETDDVGQNIREQLERHRADASCASCHDKIDPLGISLENFDAIGRWRETERDGSPLSTVATTHDGVELDGAEGLTAYLHDHREEFIDHFNRKLLGYALGRAVHIGDRALLERMASRLEDEAFRFSVRVEEIVSSPQFRMKRSGNE